MKNCSDVTCRYNLSGIVSEKARQYLCDFCDGESNYEPIRDDDLKRAQNLICIAPPKKKRKAELEEITAPIY